MKTSEIKEFECEKCGNVDWTLSFVEHDNARGENDLRFLHGVTDYGLCKVAADANGVPTSDQLDECPVWKYVQENKNTL